MFTIRLAAPILAAVLAAGALAGAGPAAASDPNGDFVLRGVGFQPCSTFLAALAQETPTAEIPPVPAFLQWADGYISARNQFTEQTYDAVPILDEGALSAIMSQLCEVNKDLPFGLVLSRVILEFRPTALTRKVEMVSATVGTETYQLPRETLQQAQRALQAKGLYSGTIDGVYGPGTATAVQTFQQQAGLPATGVLDRQSLIQLLLPTAAASP